MTVKVFKSNWTWRTIAHQDKVLSEVIPNLDATPTYIDDEGLEFLFRPTTRKEPVTLYVASLGILGTEPSFVKNIGQELNKRKWRLISVEENLDWKKVDLRELLNAWQEARTNGAAKIGARISAERKRARIKMATDKIKDRWKLPSNVWPTRILLDEVDISLNSAKSILGNRPIAQANYRAMLKRKEREAKGVRYKRADNYIDEVPDYANDKPQTAPTEALHDMYRVGFRRGAEQMREKINREILDRDVKGAEETLAIATSEYGLTERAKWQVDGWFDAAKNIRGAIERISHPNADNLALHEYAAVAHKDASDLLEHFERHGQATDHVGACALRLWAYLTSTFYKTLIGTQP